MEDDFPTSSQASLEPPKVPIPPVTGTGAKEDLRAKVELMHVIEKLKTQKRTGWVREGVKAPESIADHMYRMAMLAMMSQEDEHLDISKCVLMAIVHDLAEADVGDITPYDGITREEKQAREAAAIQRYTSALLPPSSPAAIRIRSLWEEYEAGQSKEAKFVKDLDRLEMALQAVEYENSDSKKDLQPFFTSSIPKISHPEVKSWANSLMEERKALWEERGWEGYQPVNTAP